MLRPPQVRGRRTAFAPSLTSPQSPPAAPLVKSRLSFTQMPSGQVVVVVDDVVVLVVDVWPAKVVVVALSVVVVVVVTHTPGFPRRHCRISLGRWHRPRICPLGFRHDGASVARQRTRHSARGSSLASAAGVTISSASNARKLQLHERNRMKSPYTERGDGTQS